MNAFLFIILCAQAIGVIIWTMLREERLNYFPALLAISFSGFALPQLAGLLRSSEMLPPGGLAKTLVMANLCFAAAVVGFNLRARPLKMLQWTYTPRALLTMSLILTLVGGVCYFKITRLPPEIVNMGQWSGIVTFYNFFASALPCGLVVALYLVMTRPSPLALVSAAISSLLMLDRAMMDGRRSQGVMLLLTVVLSVWLFKRKTIPRLLFLAFAVVGCLAVYSIGEYREAIMGQGKAFNSIFLGGGLGGFKNLSNIDFVQNARNIAKEGGAEYEAAVFGIADTDEKKVFDFGLSHWDGLVHHFVPAQFLGQEFKESLQFNINRPGVTASGYEKAGSTSEPGIVDAFRSFWYFGCVKFLLIGLFMRLVLTTALAGNLNFAFLYIILSPSAILIISHPIDFLIESLVHSVLLVGAAILLVKVLQPSGINPRPLAVRPPAPQPAEQATHRFSWFRRQSGRRTIRPLPRFVPHAHPRRGFALTPRFSGKRNAAGPPPKALDHGRHG